MRERRDAMIAGLRHMPEGTRCVPAGRWLLLLADAARGDVGRRALRRGRGGGRPLRPRLRLRVEGGERTLRLAYSGVGPAEIEEGMARLGGVFRAAAQAPAAA